MDTVKTSKYASQMKYYEKNKEKIKEYQKVYQLQYQRRKRQEDRKKFNEKHNRYYHLKKYGVYPKKKKEEIKPEVKNKSSIIVKF